MGKTRSKVNEVRSILLKFAIECRRECQQVDNSIERNYFWFIKVNRKLIIADTIKF